MYIFLITKQIKVFTLYIVKLIYNITLIIYIYIKPIGFKADMNLYNCVYLFIYA